MTAAGIELEERDGIGYLTLDRPPRNEMDSRLFAELRRVIADELPRLTLSGLIVRGRGRHFSSGADVPEILAQLDSETDAQARAGLQGNIDAIEALARLPYPVVAAIAGCCFGSAFELALGCHYRIAAPNALLALLESQHGLMPGCGGTARLGPLVGHGRALGLILTGRTLDAREALGLGAVERVVDKAELVPTAQAFVRAAAERRAVLGPAV